MPYAIFEGIQTEVRKAIFLLLPVLPYLPYLCVTRPQIYEDYNQVLNLETLFEFMPLRRKLNVNFCAI